MRRQLATAIAYLGAALLAPASPGYLATVGPAAFRFQAPRPPPARIAATPASIHPEPVSTNTASAVTSPTTPTTPATPAIPATPTATGTTNEIDVVFPGRPEDVVSPQMLLKYFNRATNGTRSGIIAPLDMQLPAPPQPPPSRATYSN